jgi:hypothetical protein
MTVEVAGAAVAVETIVSRWGKKKVCVTPSRTTMSVQVLVETMVSTAPEIPNPSVSAKNALHECQTHQSCCLSRMPSCSQRCPMKRWQRS